MDKGIKAHQVQHFLERYGNIFYSTSILFCFSFLVSFVDAQNLIMKIDCVPAGKLNSFHFQCCKLPCIGIDYMKPSFLDFVNEPHNIRNRCLNAHNSNTRN